MKKQYVYIQLESYLFDFLWNIHKARFWTQDRDNSMIVPDELFNLMTMFRSSYMITSN